MKKPSLLIAGLLIWGVAQADKEQLVGTWVIKPQQESTRQFQWWKEVKYPKVLKITLQNNKYSYVFTDQFGFECKGKPMVANQGKELVFEFCGGLGTKSPLNWSPIHHAKIVEGKLQGIVTTNNYLFTWVGVRQ